MLPHHDCFRRWRNFEPAAGTALNLPLPLPPKPPKPYPCAGLLAAAWPHKTTRTGRTPTRSTRCTRLRRGESAPAPLPCTTVVLQSDAWLPRCILSSPIVSHSCEHKHGAPQTQARPGATNLGSIKISKQQTCGPATATADLGCGPADSSRGASGGGTRSGHLMCGTGASATTSTSTSTCSSGS